MAEVTDDFGRVNNFKNADFDSLAESLKAAVGKAVEYAAGRAKDSNSEMEKEFEKLVDAIEELDEGIKSSIDETRKFVEEVRKASDSVEKARSRPRAAGDTLADVQREQTRILQMILASHKKATESRTAKFTSGATALSSARPKRPELKEMGFRPRGADKIPAMVGPGEFVVSKRGTSGNEPLLDRINRGYFKGGKVRPEYLAEGTPWRDTLKSAGRRFRMTTDMDKTIEIIIEGKYDKALLEKIKSDFAKLGTEVSVDFGGKFDKELRRSFARWATGITTAFTGGGDAWQVLFEGSVRDVTEFRREMRQLAFQTQGITGEFRLAQAEFAKIGDHIVSRTGKSVTAFQKAYMNNARKGFKDQKAGMKVLESGLKLSTLIGSETQATASLFADWHRELGLGAAQMERMASNMQRVARNTGVTGDELIEVMKSSEQILKNLRNQGTLTTTAARNITQAMAEFKKQGFGEEGQKLLSAMSGYSAFQGADDGTKRLLGIASSLGGVDYMDVMFGDVVQDGAKMGQMGEGLREFMADIVDPKMDPKNLDLNLITSDQRKALTIALEGIGTSLGAAEIAINTFQKSARGLGGELSDLEKITKSATATADERKQAEKKINDALMSSTMDVVGGIRQVSENFSGMNLAELSKQLDPKSDNKFSREFQESTKNLADMAPHLSDSLKRSFGLSGSAEQMAEKIKSMDMQQQIKLGGMAGAEQMDKAMREAGKENKKFSSRMQKALERNDMTMVRSISEEMAAAQSEMQVDDATNVDPIVQLEKTMQELNETIRKSFSPIVGAILDFVGWGGLIAAQVGMMGSVFHNLISKDLIGSFKTFLPGLGSKFENFATSIAGNKEIKDGMFKKFFETYADSRSGTRFDKYGHLSPFKMERGLKAPLLEKGKSKGVLGSLDEAFGGLHDDMLKRISSIGGSTVDFFKKAGKESRAFFKEFGSGFLSTWKSGWNFFDSMKGGFGAAMKSGDFATGVFAKMKDAWGALDGKFLGAYESLKKFSPTFASFLGDSFKFGKSFTTMNFGTIFGAFGKAMTSGFTLFQKAFSPTAWKNLISRGVKGIRGPILGGTLGTAQIIFAAIDMVFGAVTGFMNTGKRFEGVMKAMGKSTKEMTWGMYASSTLAGGLVGILDGLTFGLLRISGAAEFLEKTLSFVLYAVFSVVEGIVEGILYPFRMVGSAFKHIGSQLQGIGDSILGVFNAIAGIFGSEAGNWSEAFAMVYPWLKAIGVAIGYVVGLPLAGFLWLVVKGISAMLVPIQMLVAAITGVIRVIAGFIQFFVDIFRVGLWQATKNLAWTVFDAVLGVFRPVTDFLWSLMEDIIAPFRWLANILCWNSIIPDMVVEIVKWFAMLPIKIFGFMAKIPYMIGKALLGVPAAIGGAFLNIGEYLSGFGTDGPFSFLMSQLGAFYSFLGGTFNNLVGMASGVLDIIYGILTLDFGKIWGGLTSFGSALVSQAANFGSFVWKSLSNSMSFLFKALKKVPIMLLRGMKAVFYDFPSWLMGKLMEGVWAVGNFLVLTLPKIMWQAFKNSMSAVGKFVWDTLSWPFKKIWELMQWAWESIKNKAMEAWDYIKSMFDASAWASWFGGLGTYVYDGFISALQGVWDWIKSKIPGLGAVTKAADSVGKAAGAAWEGTKSAGSAAWSGLKAAGSYLNPFNYFEGYKEGTKKIEKPGLAMLHAGEMVVPKGILDKMSAIGDGAFGSLSSLFRSRKTEGEGAGKGLLGSIADKFRGAGDSFRSCCPKDAVENAEEAVSALPKAVKEALSKVDDNSFLGKIKNKFSHMTGYANNFFKPMTTGFIRARKRGEGFFTSITKGLKSQYMSATEGGDKGSGGMLSRGMEWLNKSIFGDQEGKDTKKGILQHIKDGIFGSKKGEETKKGILGVIRQGLFGDDAGVKKGLFQIAKEGLFGKEEEGRGLLGWAKDKIFGQKMTDGEMGPPKPGLITSTKNAANSIWESLSSRFEIHAQDGVLGGAKKAVGGLYGTVRNAMFGQKMEEGEMGPPRPGLLDKAKGKAGDLYTMSKDAMFGQKMAEGEMGPPRPGLLDKAKGKAGDLYGAARKKVFGKDSAERLKDIGEADKKTAGKFEGFKEKMKNIAEGIKEFSGTKVLAGAINLIPSSAGLVAMIPGTLGAKLLEKIDGERLKTALKGLGGGVSALGNAKVLLGAAALIAVGVGSLGLIPAVPILAVLGMVGPLVEKGLRALGKGLSAFGKAAANPYTWLGVALLAALNIAMIPLAYALRLISPLVEAFGKAIKGAFEGMGQMIKSATDGIVGILKEITLSRALGLFVAAGGIAALGLAMAAFAAGKFVASWIDFFSGDGLMNKILLLGSMGENLMMAGLGVEKLGKSFKTFAANKSGGWAEWFSGSDGVIEGFKELSEIGTPQFIATAEAIEKMASGMEKMHSIPTIRPMQGDATTATTPVGSAAPTSTPVADAQPVHLRDITGSILRDRAGSGGNKLQSDELTRMEDVANRQVQELEQIRQGINELVSLMRPSGGVVGGSGEMGSGNTKDPRRPMHAARFGKMKFGVPGGLANRSVVNTGEV